MNRFMSIRWKVVAITGFVMAGMAALFSWQQQIALSERFVREQLVYGDQMKAMTERLFQVQNDRLQVLARMLAEMPQLRVALGSDDAGLARQVLEPMWPELTLGQGLAGLAVFSPELNVMGQWGQGDASKFRGLAREAMSRESPQAWVECGGAACLHYVVLPLNAHGVSLGAMALVTGLEGVVLDLRRLGNAEVALMAGPGHMTGRLDQAASTSSNPIAGLRVLSVSGGEPARKVLQAAMHKTWPSSFFVYTSEAPADEPQSWNVLNLHPDLPGDGLLHIGILVNVSQRIYLQYAALWRNLLWGAAVLFASLILLYVLLRPAMNRIARVSRLLPLLGQERYEEVQNEIPRNTKTLFRDEMHSLEGLSLDLALQLRALNEADENQRQALAEQAKMLEQERDFIAGVLDTAPVMIVTYGHDGRLRMVNAYTVLDCGVPRERLIGQGFGELFMVPSQRKGFQKQLQSQSPGDIRRGEGNFVRADEVRDVLWFHSCFDNLAGDRTYLSVGLDVTEHRQAEERLKLLVERDSVTGLLSRRAFKRKFESMLEKGAKGMVLVCDLDEFRSLNDAEGHEAGDRVLMLFAQHIQHMQPSPVLTARLGSDEFAMVFLGLNEADGILLARHLSRFASHQSVLSDAGVSSRHLTASVGLTSFTEGASADVLLGDAELALTRARAKGHGSWHLYSEQEAYRESADRRTHWRNEVESALDENRFVLHFQPILHISSGELSHYEALLRMVDHDGKLIPPGMFVEVAESTGLIRRIDRWVVEAAVKTAADRPDVNIALNLSSRSFDDDMAFETMQAAMEKHHVSGERLLLEITETAALANLAGAKRIMDKFLGLGCVFGLDDFGVGFSSFQYLRELPVGFVKIDGSFVKNLTKNPDDVVFVRALNSAVQGFGKTTVAEFVEDETSLAILREIGVDYAQGYLIGKPGAEMWPPGHVGYVSPP